MRRFSIGQWILAFVVVCGAFDSYGIAAEQPAAKDPSANSGEKRSAANSPERQAKLEAALAKMLSGATLEGSFTSTNAGSDPTKLSQEKYMLGEVKKVSGDLWVIPARIQYGEKDFTLPITLPILWAGDTPIVTVDNLPLPGFGTVSARVMFFEGHYAGYWKHGAHGGNLFGVIHSAKKNETASPPIDNVDSPRRQISR